MIKGKHPIKLYVYLLFSTLGLISIPLNGGMEDSSNFMIIVQVGVPAFFFAMVIDSFAKVEFIEFKDYGIAIKVQNWYALNKDTFYLKKDEVKSIEIGSNGYTIEINGKNENLKFDARYCHIEGRSISVKNLASRLEKHLC
jgi:hypothetical protein